MTAAVNNAVYVVGRPKENKKNPSPTAKMTISDAVKIVSKYKKEK